MQQDTTGLPTLVSFYAGRQYYHDAAERLRRDCERLGMPHDIVELDSGALDWASICRLKIQFYQQMHQKHGSILWVDVDDRLLRLPTMLANCSFDIAGFGGRFRYIRDFDPYQVTRFWVPSILYFGDTPAASEFIEMMIEIEAETDEAVTDDWVLHETWVRHTTQMNVGLLAPNLVARKQEQINDRTIVLHGDSGSVSEFRGQVVQHEKLLDNLDLRTTVLLHESRILMKGRERASALLLAERAHALSPASKDAAIQYANYLAFNGKRTDAIELLESFLDTQSDASPVREAIVHHARLIDSQDVVARHLTHLRDDPDSGVRARAASTAYEFEFDRRAKEAGIKRANRLKMWWMKTPYPGNFGDILSPWIVEKASGIPPLFGTRAASLLAIGSIIKFATEKSTVWGSGTPRLDDALSPDANYLAVRGPITRRIVMDNGGTCPDVYGDPGLLLPRFIEGTKMPSYRLGLIRHVNHRGTGMVVDEEVREIDLLGVGSSFIEDTVRAITDCEAILTTSLHGLIIAHAYGIPARLCYLSDGEAITGDGTKYEDYFASVGLRPQEALDLSEVDKIDASLLRHLDSSVDIKFDGDRLVDSLVSSNLVARNG